MNTQLKFRDVNTDMSDIPSYASIEEATILVAEANNAMFDSLKREIGLQELGVFETTGNFISYVIEEGETAGEEAKEEKKSFIDKGKEIAGGTVNKGKELAKKFIELVKKALGKIKGLFESAMKKMIEGNLKIEDIKDFEALNKFNTVKAEAKSLSVKAVCDYLEGEAVDHTLTNDEASKNAIKDIVKVIKTFKEGNAFIKALYKKCNDYYNDVVKEAEAESEPKPNWIEYNKTQVANTTIVFGAALQSYYKLIRQDVGIAIKLAAKSKLPGKKKAAEGENTAAETAPAKGETQKESANFSAEVDSLFNWSF